MAQTLKVSFTPTTGGTPCTFGGDPDRSVHPGLRRAAAPGPAAPDGTGRRPSCAPSLQRAGMASGARLGARAAGGVAPWKA